MILNIQSKKERKRGWRRYFYKRSKIKIDYGERNEYINVKIYDSFPLSNNNLYLESNYNSKPLLKTTIDYLRLKYGDDE